MGDVMRTISMAAAMLGMALLAVPALAADGAYGDNWYRGEFWSGEYPDGFTVLKDVTVKLRATLDPKAEATIDCALPAKATYQPWNSARVNADGLQFVSFTEIEDMEVTKDYETTLYNNLDATATPVKFAKGDKWKYLAYFGEGAFLMEYDGVRYDGDQDLMEVSKAVGGGAEKDYDEWLRINCSNQMWGWLFMDEIVKDDVNFTAPNIVTYGEAADLE